MLCLLFAYSANFKGNKNGFVWDGRWSQKLAHNYKNKYDNYIAGTQFRENAANMMLGFNKHWGYSHLILSYYHLTLDICWGRSVAIAILMLRNFLFSRYIIIR